MSGSGRSAPCLAVTPVRTRRFGTTLGPPRRVVSPRRRCLGNQTCPAPAPRPAPRSTLAGWCGGGPEAGWESSDNDLSFVSLGQAVFEGGASKAQRLAPWPACTCLLFIPFLTAHGFISYNSLDTFDHIRLQFIMLLSYSHLARSPPAPATPPGSFAHLCYRGP